MEPETFTMSEKIFLINMLDNLRPSVWNRFMLTLIILGTAYRSFERLVQGTAGIMMDLVMSMLGLAAVFFVWTDYRAKHKTYHLYQRELIKLTEPKR